MPGDTRTEVSKSDPAIKKILAATLPAWKGRRVVVIATRDTNGGEWTHTVYIDDQTHAWFVRLDSMSATATRKPFYGGPPLVLRPTNDYALVIHQRFMGKDTGVEIIIPESRLDPAAISVATDAIIEKNKAKAKKALADLGDTAGIAMAVAEARAKTLGKAEAVNAGAEQTPRSKRQLEREIGAILGRDIFGRGLT